MKEFNKSVAVVIGINNYTNGISQLRLVERLIPYRFYNGRPLPIGRKIMKRKLIGVKRWLEPV